MRRSPWGPEGAAALAGAGLLLLAFAVYAGTRFGPFHDPKFALLTSESLVERGSWDLSPYLPGLAPRPQEAPGEVDRPYQLVARGERLLYLYPPGTPLLAVPFAVASRALGDSAVGSDGRYDSRGELRAQRRIASLVTALTVVLIFAAARRELPLGPALTIALAAAFGSSLWTTASRALWSHTFSCLLAAAALLEAQRWERGGRPRPVVLGALASALFWVRPTNAVAAIGFAVWVAVRHRPGLVRLLATGLAGLLAYVVHSLVHWGSLAPSYVVLSGGLGRGRNWAVHLARDTIDVERGLLVSSPVLLALLWSLARRGVPGERRPLASLAAGISLGITVVYVTGAYPLSGTPGPRFLTDLVPYLALLGALAWRARREQEAGARTPRWRRITASALLGVLIAAGVAAQVEWTERGPGRRRSAVERAAAPGATRTVRLRLEAWSWRDLPQASFVARWMGGRGAPPQGRTGRSTSIASP